MMSIAQATPVPDMGGAAGRWRHRAPHGTARPASAGEGRPRERRPAAADAEAAPPLTAQVGAVAMPDDQRMPVCLDADDLQCSSSERVRRRP